MKRLASLLAARGSQIPDKVPIKRLVALLAARGSQILDKVSIKRLATLLAFRASQILDKVSIKRLAPLLAVRASQIRQMRLGIVARLSISFVGVAALIVAANIVVQKGMLVESTTRVTALAPVATPVEVKQEPVAPPAPVAPALPPPDSPFSIQSALSALARYEQAGQLRTRDDSVPNNIEYAQASGQFQQSLRLPVNKPEAPIFRSAASRISSEFKAYTAQVDALIKEADTHRATEVTRIELLEHLNARVKQSLARAWTVFGRVVARQSLVQLSAQLDSLRENSEALGADTPLTDAQIAEIADAEQRVQKTLADNESGFRSSQGDAWYQEMGNDMVRLGALRESSTQLSAQISADMQLSTAHASQLRQSLFNAQNIVPPASAAPAAPAKVAKADPPALPMSKAAPAHGSSTVETKSVSRMPDPSSRRLIAWASGAAAFLMLIMCVGIVVNILAPVRRLLRATSEIAAGNHSVRVASGGITELDALTTGFNSMANELALAKAASHEYQQDLEGKILERTRKLQELSERDPLTGLPNRRYLFALLDAAIERARTSNHAVGVLFLDIDNFKIINDGLGHAFGDSVLVAMGRRLAELASPHGFAARLGGDEFMVIMECARSLDEIRAVGESVVAALRSPLIVEGAEVIASVSVGACSYPDHAEQSAALLKAADMALFRAKALGRSQLSMFTSDLQDAAAAKFATEQGLRRAIERGEFELFYQPEVDVETLEVAQVEALIRWRTASGQVLLPSEFLWIAEEAGLAIEIGNWVLRSAIAAASGWQRNAWPAAKVAINVSPRQLCDGLFVDRVLGLLAEYQLPSRCVEIELTESVLQNGPSTVEALRRLREHGIAVALDDFGTGYSSLASVETLPLTRIKLDRSLISGIPSSARSTAIAEAIIGMCQGLGLEITAEGVETPEQFRYLVQKRSMAIQGFLLATPVPENEVVQQLALVKPRAQELLITSDEKPARAKRSATLADQRQLTAKKLALKV
jgi:diguanylate cyclase (GGDEF)-like protein